MSDAQAEARHEVRISARADAVEGIAPYVAGVDETGRFPQESYDASVASQLHAPSIPRFTTTVEERPTVA